MMIINSKNLSSVFLDVCESGSSDDKGGAVIKSHLFCHTHRLSGDEDTRFHSKEVGHFLDELYFSLDGCHIALDIPRKLQGAIHRLTDGDNTARIIPEPFVEGNVHPLGSTLDI